MFTKQQEILLDRFADLSDKLLDLGVISTDSFTGEIGEYIACRLFDLNKTNRVTKAVDGVSRTGEKYQVKSKITENNFSYNLKDLETTIFDFLVIVYFDKLYNTTKVLRIPSKKIKNNEIKISASNIKSFEQIDISKLKLPIATKKAINDFAKAYHDLEKNEIIRSRRIVGDIGEFYACRRLNLQLCENRNEKGIDARHSNGLLFEIKTRRVYQSSRRISETRRLNNLVNKSADYLIVVTIDRAFKCSGMWLIPMQNVSNPKSANLRIINNTPGTLNLIPSNISWLATGEPFKTFVVKKKTANKSTNNQQIQKKSSKQIEIKPTVKREQAFKQIDNNMSTKGLNKFLTWLFIIIFLIAIIGYLID